jgi:hypothetical protein
MRKLITLTLITLALTACATTDYQTGQPITCTAGSDCDEKWSRAMRWLEQNTSSKVTVTDMQLSAEESVDAAKPAFEVTKATPDEGKTFQITMRAWCAAGNCDNLIGPLRTSFYGTVLGR